MKKHNCWEFMKCGRHVGGDRADEAGICPVAAENSADGLNGGINGGRLCWVVSDSGCQDTGRNSNLRGEDCCFQCEFRYKVTIEEGLLNVCNATGIFLNNNRKKK